MGLRHDDSDPSAGARVTFGGDVMLGRLVGEAILHHGGAYPLGPVAGLMRAADLTIVNLECAITSSAHLWPGAPKAFYFGAPLPAIASLTGAGVDLVSLANNHVLDYDVTGLRDTMRALRRHGIALAGAGENLAQACAPAIVERAGMRFGMACFCDHQEDFAARQDAPGMAYLDMDDAPATLSAWRDALAALRREHVDWPILSLHWGPNMVRRPSARFRRLAHGAIDMGWKILFGHSAHVFQGIELYRGCPILYAVGDLVDDYYVDPEFRNDHQLLIEMELGRSDVRRVLLHPLLIGRCQVRPASGEHFRWIVKTMTTLCRELGTAVSEEEGVMLIRIQADGVP